MSRSQPSSTAPTWFFHTDSHLHEPYQFYPMPHEARIHNAFFDRLTRPVTSLSNRRRKEGSAGGASSAAGSSGTKSRVGIVVE